MKPNSHKRTSFQPKRCGVAAMVALVCVIIVGAVSTALLRDVYLNRMHRYRARLSVQANILLADFLVRTEERSREMDFKGETLKVPRHLTHTDGTFVLRSEPHESENATKMTCHVEFHDSNGDLILALER